MDTSKLKKFASFARTALIEQVGTRLKTVLGEKSLARRESPKAIEELERKLKELGEKRVVETVAYTWFNRFCALRYMDVNRYTRIGVLSPADGQFQPEILAEAKMGHIDDELVPEATHRRVLRLLDGTDPSSDPQGEAYRLLLVAVCNYYHTLMPFMFEKIADYTELLLPDDLLSATSIPACAREALLPENCSPEHTEESVEVIGWLYQFYIADKKDEVFNGLKKGKKITPENIPAATQLFTPHWIVRYLVENSLGRLWMLNHPESQLVEKMEYYIKPDAGIDASDVEPPMWQPAWKDHFPMQDGRVDETMWLRPNPSLIGNYQEAMFYALSIDGYTCAKEPWFGGDDLAEASQRWEKSDFKGCSFKQLRTALFFFQRDARWNDIDPDENSDDPFWKCYKQLVVAWNEEWRDHIDELPSLPPVLLASAEKPQVAEEDFIRISSPEEIKVCDPACGSGHMLTYAFDLLYEIYREEQYAEPEISSLILKNNLFGIEIDQRAGALAAFALTMKAREKDKRFFTRKSQPDASARDLASGEAPKSKIQNPNICVLENIKIDPDDLSAYMDKVGRDLFSSGLQGVVNQWEEADNFGSLIRPLVTDVSDVLELLHERQMGEDLFLADVHQKVLKGLRQAGYLSPKYHVVVANPPYMGNRNVNLTLQEFAKSNFPKTKSDVFAMFIERNEGLCVDMGNVAMVTMQSWMFLSTFEQLRKHIFDNTRIVSMIHLGPRAFDTIGGEVVNTTAFVTQRSTNRESRGTFVRLVEGGSEKEKRNLFHASKRNPYLASSNDFAKVPGSPLAYWITNSARETFVTFPKISTISTSAVGQNTGDNDRFLKYWYEVSNRLIDTTCCSREETYSGEFRWYPYNKGGPFRKWYGNFVFVINWHRDAEEIKEYAVERNGGKHWSRYIQNLEWLFQEGVTWSDVTSGKLSGRHLPPGYISDVSGHCAFFDKGVPCEVGLAIMNSSFIGDMSTVLNPTIHFQAGNYRDLPFSDGLNTTSVVERVKTLISHSKSDWDSSEISTAFLGHDFEKLADSLRAWWSTKLAESRDLVDECLRLESENDAAFNDAYSLQYPSNVAKGMITLACNPHYRYGSEKSESELEALLLADTMREFISYAVGCMLGRYSLDKPGLILANQGETAADYRKHVPEPTFAPDEDNVLPVLEGEWFSDDISQRFKDFLKVTFGTEHYDENLAFLENALYPDNVTAKKRKTIRDYFLKEFYDHHLKMYKKRPIYWLFSSPKGTFNALIYMHRYRPDTVGIVLQYLRDFRDKLAHHADHRQMIADSTGASKTEKTQAIKEVATIKKQLKELEDYEKTLFEVAARKLDIDLDDGVKHNYQLFGPVLKKIPGLAAKED